MWAKQPEEGPKPGAAGADRMALADTPAGRSTVEQVCAQSSTLPAANPACCKDGPCSAASLGTRPAVALWQQLLLRQTPPETGAADMTDA